MDEVEQRTCPMCRQVGPYTKLQLGIEAALWVDCTPEYYAFVPCGHMCSESTVRCVRGLYLYWIALSYLKFFP